MSLSAKRLKEAVAAQVRQAYITAVRRHHQQRRGLPSNYTVPSRWDGGRDAAGVMHEPIWPKIAKKLLEKGVDPQAFVSAQFESYGPVPNPGMLLHDRAMQLYNYERSIAAEEISGAYQVQLQRALSEVGCRIALKYGTEVECWISVLWDISYELSALFRYCMAVRLLSDDPHNDQLKKLRKAYKVGAAIQYSRFPKKYRKVWGDMIPVDFARKAGQLAIQVAKEGA